MKDVARGKQAYEWSLAGWTYREIGTQLGLSATRAGSIVKAYERQFAPAYLLQWHTEKAGWVKKIVRGKDLETVRRQGPLRWRGDESVSVIPLTEADVTRLRQLYVTHGIYLEGLRQEALMGIDHHLRCVLHECGV